MLAYSLADDRVDPWAVHDRPTGNGRTAYGDRHFLTRSSAGLSCYLCSDEKL